MQQFCWLLAAALTLLGCASSAASGSASSAEKSDVVRVMVLGTYHMAGSTSDLINVEMDSVLSERRQAELADVVDALADFAPTVVVTERVTAPPDYIDPKFAEFTEATLLENENERVQIAYRLARKAGVTRVYGLDEQPSGDEPNYFPFPKLAAHAEAIGRKAELDSLLGKLQTTVETFATETADRHIATRLLSVNTGPMSSPDFYYVISDFDEGEAQPAAELHAYWFMRNAKIWSKLIDVTKPGDRVVVVYGAGHKHWLEHMAQHTPGYSRVDPAPYLERAAERASIP